ncbi:pseudouridine synthase [Alkaliphilus oremlandii]|uniref:Pseudouridine synthase n=1 Tax=Alkaliphilus oremlandii (strain OhILAs) TaxID=350688 RepID=A8MFF7_ALKOO|nr:pseudouridine synthase [Alkaliphilus oremlandii]ABW19120.1 pseudouridine synthase [Alkaliphilus oremlandii OhILAs]
MRLQKFLAANGVASRRKSEELISSGRVKVNGNIITEMGYKVDLDIDKISVDNKDIILQERKVYILLNKPTGYVTTVSEQFNRKKVTDLVDVPYRIFPVGRLDYNTSGLLILTNDGELTYKLTHPKFKVEKVYIAKVKGIPTKEALEAFENGLKIEDYITAPAKIKILKEINQHTLVEVRIREGKNRQVRKMCEAIGHPVVELKRIAMGRIHLGNLDVGNWRYFTEREIAYLKQL